MSEDEPPPRPPPPPSDATAGQECGTTAVATAGQDGPAGNVIRSDTCSSVRSLLSR